MSSCFKEANKHHKGTRQFLRKIVKSLPEYLILQRGFVLSIKIQNTSASQAERHILNRTPNFANLCFLFALVEVMLYRTPLIPRKKYTSEYFFYKTAPSGYFRLY